MAEIKNSLLENVVLKNKPSFENFSSRDIAWEKELEKQIYERSTSQIVPESASVKKNASSEEVVVFEKLADKFIVDRSADTKSGFGGFASNVKSGAALQVGLPRADAYVPHKMLDTAHYVGLGSAVSNIQSVGSQMPNVSHSDSALEKSISVFNVERQDVSIKHLADGEVVVRNFISVLPVKSTLESIIKELKFLLGRDVNKLKVNGEIVWEQQKKPSNHNTVSHKVNLLF
jgi:hypothetical protein